MQKGTKFALSSNIPITKPKEKLSVCLSRDSRL